MFRSGVGRDATGRPEPFGGRDVDHPTVVIAGEHGKRCPNKARIGSEVDRHGGLPCVDPGVFVGVDSDKKRHTGVVDENVDRPKSGSDVGNARLDRALLGDITHKTLCDATVGDYRSDGLGNPLLVAINDGHACALVGEKECSGPAHSGCCARNKGDASGDGPIEL